MEFCVKNSCSCYSCSCVVTDCYICCNRMFLPTQTHESNFLKQESTVSTSSPVSPLKRILEGG